MRIRKVIRRGDDNELVLGALVGLEDIAEELLLLAVGTQHMNLKH